MKLPRAELTPRQIAAQNPSELQVMARKHNLEYGNLCRDVELLKNQRMQLNERMQKYNRYMRPSDTAAFQDSLFVYDQLIAELAVVRDRIQGLQEAERALLKKRSKQNWRANHVKRDN